jgi:RecA-family ATPase
MIKNTTDMKERQPKAQDLPFIQFLSYVCEHKELPSPLPESHTMNNWREDFQSFVEMFQEEGIEGFFSALNIEMKEHPYLQRWLSQSDEKLREILKPRGTNLADVVPQPIRWMWPQRIAFRKLHMFDGDGGIGKSLIMHDIAARLTTGRPMPHEEKALVSGGVVLVNMEEDLADTVQPRLARAGARLDRIEAIGEVTDYNDDGTEYVRPFQYPHDLPLLEAAIERVQAKLVGQVAISLP